MSRRKAPDLKWIGGDSRSSVWFALSKLLMPAEHERVETVRKSRQARVQKAREEASAASALERTTENAGADVQEAQNTEEGEQEEETSPTADENKAPASGEAETEPTADNDPKERADGMSVATNENDGQETPQATGNDSLKTSPGDAQPCSTKGHGQPESQALAGETTPNGFSRVATMVETPTPQSLVSGTS